MKFHTGLKENTKLHLNSWTEVIQQFLKFNFVYFVFTAEHFSVRWYKGACKKYGIFPSSLVVRHLNVKSCKLDLSHYGLGNEGLRPLCCALLVSPNYHLSHANYIVGKSSTTVFCFNAEHNFPS